MSLILQTDLKRDLNGFIQIGKDPRNDFLIKCWYWLKSPTSWDFLSTSDSDYQVETTLVFQGPKHKSSIYLFLNKFNKFTETTSSYTKKTAPPIIIHSARNWNLDHFLNISKYHPFGVVGFVITTKYEGSVC